MYRWQFLKSYDCYKEENNCKCFIFVVYVTGCAAETMQCVKSVQEVFSGPYSVRMRENTDKIKLRIWTLFMSWWSQYFQRVYCIGQALIRYGLISSWTTEVTAKSEKLPRIIRHISLWKKRWLYSVISRRFPLNLCMTQSRGVFRTMSKICCGAYLLK